MVLELCSICHGVIMPEKLTIFILCYGIYMQFLSKLSIFHIFIDEWI